MKDYNSSPKAKTRSLRAEESPNDLNCPTLTSAAPHGTKRSTGLSAVRPIPRRVLCEAARERGTIHEAVAILGICARTVRHLALLGEFRGAAKIGRRWTFNLERLRDYVEQKERESCRSAKHPRERSGAVRFSGDGFKPTALTSDGRYARTIQSLRSQGEKGK